MDSNAIIERHPKFYIPSGDVVLTTKLAPKADEGLPRYQAFRVHKFFLALRSTVFSNLFTDAGGAVSNEESSYDGVPLVELHGDDAQDVTLLLSYIYEPESALAFRHHDPNTPIAVSGVVRLSDKYLLEPLRKRLVSEVVQAWPTTLREWDIQQADIEAIKTVNLTIRDDPDVDRGPPLCDIIPEPASAIVFAQEFGRPEILPAAFYRLLQIPFDDDWSVRPHPATYSSRSLARWSLLDRDNLARYIHGLQAAENYTPDVRRFMYSGCAPKIWEGDEDSSCLPYVKHMFAVLGRGSGARAARDPLRWLADCGNHYGFPELLEKYPKGLCEDCCASVAYQVPRERQRIWRELLPKWFQLE